jgi:hypothetical protein
VGNLIPAVYQEVEFAPEILIILPQVGAKLLAPFRVNPTNLFDQLAWFNSPPTEELRLYERRNSSLRLTESILEDRLIKTELDVSSRAYRQKTSEFGARRIIESIA